MISFAYPTDLAELCGRLGMLAALLFGVPASPSTQSTEVSTVQLSPDITFDVGHFSPSASTSVEDDAAAQPLMSLPRARAALQQASSTLARLDVRDPAADAYIAAVRTIIEWVDRPGSNLRTDAATLATSLEAARARFSERTNSLDQWLALNSCSGTVTVIPWRFVVVSEPEPLALPDYEGRRLARLLLA